MRWLAAVLSVLLVVAVGEAMAGFDEGVAAYNRGDYAAALREWRPLAEQGDALAQGNLGFMYDNGQGVPQDYAEAVKWYRLAAEQGNAEAQFNLGLTYYNGEGVPQDYARAVGLWRKAAEQGYAEAQYNLGLIHATGQGVPQDYIQAHMWLYIAASRFPPGEKRDEAVRNRDHAASLMIPAQIAEAQYLAREWMEKHGK